MAEARVDIALPGYPALAPSFDRGLADFDLRQVVHFSGGYQLPFGKGQHYMNTGGIGNAVLGGWAINWIVTLQGGQPITLGCPTGPTSGTSCYDFKVPGQSQKLGFHTDSNGKLSLVWESWSLPATLRARSEPAQLQLDASLLRHLPVIWAAITRRRPDRDSTASTSQPSRHSKFSERFSMQFRAEFFNILNHPNFNAPELWRQRCGGDSELRQLQQFQLWRNWIHARCSIRSKTDSICSEAVLLG